MHESYMFLKLSYFQLFFLGKIENGEIKQKGYFFKYGELSPQILLWLLCY